MDFSQDILRDDEKIMLSLRTLYSNHGYACFRMSRFEEYELYSANRAFLPHGDIITFTDTGGKLMALRPDVTLSIVKSIRNDNKLKKLYYNENVYRTVENRLKEQMQIGLECIGDIDAALTGEVIMLAKRSLDIFGNKTRLDISHMGFINALILSDENAAAGRTQILQCLRGKNAHGLHQVCEKYKVSSDLCQRLSTLAALRGTFSDIGSKLRRMSINNETAEAIDNLGNLFDTLRGLKADEGINIDFSVSGDITYYNGIVFQGFVEGMPSMILSGGRYDKLLRSFNNDSGAIGFAVYLDAASGTAAPDTDIKRNLQKGTDNKMLSVALPKGRLGDEAYGLFKQAGYVCPDMSGQSRRLVFENPAAGIRYLWVKPSDVAVYVERGVADIGVVGKDTLLETGSDVYELLDLNLGKCRMCVAGVKGRQYNIHGKTLRVATKFPNITRRYYDSLACDIDIINLHGSIELAPLIGLSDVIVDLVQTGATLTENNMEIVDIISHISARLIANKPGYKFNTDKIDKICREIREGINL